MMKSPGGGSALARLKAGICLIDDIDPPLAPDDLVVAVAAAQGFQGVTDFHGSALFSLLAGLIGTPPPPVNATWPPVVSTKGLLYSPRGVFKPCNGTPTAF